MKATDHGRSTLDGLRRLAALVCLAGLGLTAQAASTVTLSEQLTGWSPNPGGGWVRNAYNPRSIDAANATRSWAAAGAGASAKVIATDVSVIAGRAGVLPVTSAMSVGIGDAAGAVARCLLGGGVVCGAASAAAAAYAAYRVYSAPDGSGLAADPGTDPTPSGTGPGIQVCRTSSLGCYSAASEQAACQLASEAVTLAAGQVYKDYYNANPPYTLSGATGVRTPNSNCVVRRCTSAAPSGCAAAPGFPAGVGTTTITTESSCPASIDPTDPAGNVPAGSPIGPDGKCPTARYNRAPITAQQAADKVVANPPADPTPWVQATKDAIDTGGQNAPAGITTTGPASQTGTPTSTTTTGGSPSQTITETKTPTYTYNYAGDTITYNTSITNVTNNITTGTTTTTTTNTPAATPQDPTDPCTANPDRLGCLKLGSTPTDTVPTKAPNISYTAESVGLPSGCPADQVIAGKAYSFGPICAAATNARPWVIVGAIFSALMLMLAGVRQI